MDLSGARQPIILVTLIIFSAIFSMSETALTTINKLRIRSLADDDVRGAKTVLKLIEEPGKMLSAILIGNNIINISASALATKMAIDIWGDEWIGLVTGLLTILILIFGEITPKSIATIYSEKISLYVAGPFLFFTKLLTPIIYIINKLCTGIMLFLHIDPKAKASAITENELRNILDYSH
ncbi:MAG TPA: DUF21 domain-containing protein, partial [Mobilitalea sp.]|nr:DUF21 domain-containing protein [Mobilitalea sp.]